MTEQRCDFCGARAKKFATVTVPRGWTASLDEQPKPERKKDADEVTFHHFFVMGTVAGDGSALDACHSCIRRLLVLHEQFKAARKELIGY